MYFKFKDKFMEYFVKKLKKKPSLLKTKQNKTWYNSIYGSKLLFI